MRYDLAHAADTGPGALYEPPRIHGLQQERGHVCVLEPIFQDETIAVQNLLDVSGDRVADSPKKGSTVLA